MNRKALQLAATAYLTGDTQLSNAALSLAMRHPRDRRAITLSKGGGVPAGFTRTTHNGVPVTFNGKPVFDDGQTLYVRAA